MTACPCDPKVRKSWSAITRSNRSRVPNKVPKESDLTKSNAPIKTADFAAWKKALIANLQVPAGATFGFCFCDYKSKTRDSSACCSFRLIWDQWLSSPFHHLRFTL